MQFFYKTKVKIYFKSALNKLQKDVISVLYLDNQLINKKSSMCLCISTVYTSTYT